MYLFVVVHFIPAPISIDNNVFNRPMEPRRLPGKGQAILALQMAAMPERRYSHSENDGISYEVCRHTRRKYPEPQDPRSQPIPKVRGSQRPQGPSLRPQPILFPPRLGDMGDTCPHHCAFHRPTNLDVRRQGVWLPELLARKTASRTTRYTGSKANRTSSHHRQ